MVRHFRWFALLILLALLPQGCQETQTGSSASAVPHIRVRLLQDTDRVSLHGIQLAHASLQGQEGERLIGFTKNVDIPLTLLAGAWRLGGSTLGTGVLTIRPGSSDELRVNGSAYRGIFRFIPTGTGTFDAINDLEVDDYLKGVVPAEMYHNWHLEAYKAQAVASRTYALYEAHSAGIGRDWDVYPDERSQMYGGILSETSQGREAVDATAGTVLTYGPGDGKIFKAYFSSCCGGITQAAVDAFPGETFLPPLSEQYHGACCNASKYFNWRPITIRKEELSRRFRVWAVRQSKISGRVISPQNILDIYLIDTVALNRYGRPTRVVVTDVRNQKFNWSAEQFRAIVNTDAQPGTTLPSSFCRINCPPNSDTVTFFDGHGFGHGVGMCQWCAEAQAAGGQRYDQILLEAYPHAKLERAY